MGKKNKKDKVDKKSFNRGLMNFAGDLGGSKEAKELLERYNVKGSSSHYGTKPDARNLPEHFRDNDVVKRELNEAMNKDYDTRRTIEAAAMAGNKDAKKFAKKGIDGKKGMLGAWDLMKDLKKEYVGGGGMRGAKNEAGLTYALVKADRDKFTEDIKGMIPEQEADSSTADNVDEKKEIVLSEHMQKAKDQVDAYESSNMDVYNPEARDAQKTGYKSPFAADAKKTFGIDEAIDINKVNKSEDEQAQDFLKEKTDKTKKDFGFSRVY